jgi:hypothetical protein
VLFASTLELKFKEESSKVMHLRHSFCCVETWRFREVDHTFKELMNCSAGNEWRGSVGLIMGECKSIKKVKEWRNVQ